MPEPDAVVLPGYAYVPGTTPRHREGAFDHIRATVRPGMTVDDLAETAAFRAGLAYLAAGYFWEAHEVLEPVWMALDEGSAERRLVQGLIQLANARLKMRMNRPRAARRLCAIARSLLEEVGRARCMSVSVSMHLRALDNLERSLPPQ